MESAASAEAYWSATLLEAEKSVANSIEWMFMVISLVLDCGTTKHFQLGHYVDQAKRRRSVQTAKSKPGNRWMDFSEWFAKPFDTSGAGRTQHTLSQTTAILKVGAHLARAVVSLMC